MPRRIQERAPLEETLVAIDEPSDVGGIVSSEATPQDEEVTTRDDARGIELQPDQLLDRREDPATIGSVSLCAEELRVDDEPPRRATADLDLAHHA